MKTIDYYQKQLRELQGNDLYRQLQEYDGLDAIKFIKNLQESPVKKKTSSKNYKKSTSKSSESIKNNQSLICFASNDYLDLSSNELVKKSAIQAIKKFGVGARSSRYITGNNHLYHQLERQLSKWKNCDDCIIFSSGYIVAIGVIPALMGKGDLIIADKLIHSCLLDGAKLSQAKLLRFKHNDIEHCQKILKENRKKFKNCLIISETIFSMDVMLDILVMNLL